MYPGGEAEETAFENSLLDTPVEPQSTPAPVAEPAAEPSTPEAATPPAETTTQEPEFDPNAVDYEWSKPAPAATVEYTDDFNKSIEERFGKHGIKSGKDIESIFGEVTTYKTKLQELEAKLAESEKKASPFANDYQKKLFEFTKDWDGSNGSAIAEFERLNSLDLSKMTDRDKLKEAYILENRGTMGRDKASRIFELEYEEKYDTSQLDPEINAREIEKKTLILERDAANAAKKLTEAVNTFRPESPKAQQPVENVKLTEAIKQAPSMVEAQLKDFGVLEVRLDPEGKLPAYKMGLSPDKIAAVNEEVKAHFSNPANYNADGKEKDGLTPKTMADVVARLLFHDEIVLNASKRYHHLMKMEEVKGRQPAPQRQLAAASANGKPAAKDDEEAFLQSLED